MIVCERVLRPEGKISVFRTGAEQGACDAEPKRSVMDYCPTMV